MLGSVFLKAVATVRVGLHIVMVITNRTSTTTPGRFLIATLHQKLSCQKVKHQVNQEAQFIRLTLQCREFGSVSCLQRSVVALLLHYSHSTVAGSYLLLLITEYWMTIVLIKLASSK